MVLWDRKIENRNLEGEKSKFWAKFQAKNRKSKSQKSKIETYFGPEKSKIEKLPPPVATLSGPQKSKIEPKKWVWGPPYPPQVGKSLKNRFWPKCQLPIQPPLARKCPAENYQLLPGKGGGSKIKNTNYQFPVKNRQF